EDNTEIQVVLSITRQEHTVEVTVLFNSLILRSEETTDDMYASIDLVVDKLEKQVIKYRKKLNRRLRQGGRQINEQLVPQNIEKIEEENDPKIVRTKQFILKPMPVEEAILQMNLLSHDFFVFNSAETDTISVLYRRKDGNYGLIEPEF
ncbi:MAG: ribosome-associated translation inhibitor RaiA, partial [Dethiobacteria bacterium]